MWIKRERFEELQDQKFEALEELKERDRVIAGMSRQIEGLDHQLRNATTLYNAAHTALQLEVRALLERLVTAEGEARKSVALVAMWTVRVNQLQHERDQLLHRALPGLEIRTPHVTAGSNMFEPTMNFDHDPYAPQTADPNALTPLDDDAIDGLPGEIFPGITP